MTAMGGRSRAPIGRFFGFPAKPSILVDCCPQMYDNTRFFETAALQKIFTLSFPARQGTGEAASPSSATRRRAQLLDDPRPASGRCPKCHSHHRGGEALYQVWMTSPRSAFLVSRKSPSAAPLQLRDTGSGAVFVLLRGTAADAAGAFDDAVAHDRNGPLTHDHVAARGGGNAARGRLVGALG
jgi:hypothetical protein